ncbi:MAG: hypothetical protein JWP63_5703 [Candidatus Solibacter sp.]|nr:hypothetical protein [Candidatus Solibacter sp.]
MRPPDENHSYGYGKAVRSPDFDVAFDGDGSKKRFRLACEPVLSGDGRLPRANCRLFLFRPVLEQVLAGMRFVSLYFRGRTRRRLASLLLFVLPAMSQQYTSRILSSPPVAVLNGTSTGQQVGIDNGGHATLLTGDADTAIDLHPVAYPWSMATATDGVDQCGYVFTGTSLQAMKWSGSAATAAPLSNLSSACLATHGGQQVGFAEFLYGCCTVGAPLFLQTHAFLWSGGVATDLAAVYDYSRALGVRNGQQVGYGWFKSLNVAYPYDTDSYETGRALMWTGTAASIALLHPAGYASSQALATTGVEQGGWATDAATLSRHAVLWSGAGAITKPSLFTIMPSGFLGANPSVWLTSGTPGIALDLHPAGYTDTRINALNDLQQVGDGWVGAPGAVGSVRHALVWSGIAASVIDLNQFLPPGYTHAIATGIDASGNVVGYAYNTPLASSSVVRTVPVPSDAVAVLFTPSPLPAATVSALTLSPANPLPGTTLQGTVSLNGPAPAGGLALNFQSSDAALLAVPAPVVILQGQSSATFSTTVGGASLQVPTIAKLLASDGAASRSAGVVVTPAVNIASVSVDAVEGGFFTTGTVTLKIPAQFGGALVTVTLGNPALAGLVDSLTNSVTVPAGATTANFRVSTASVSAVTSTTVSASLNGQTVSSTVSLSPAPPVAVSTISIPTIVGGQSAAGTVTVNNYPRNPGGIVISLTSGDTKTLQVPAMVTIPQYAFTATFPVTTTVVTGAKGVSVKAASGASNVTATVTVVPIPAITIVQADYLTDTHTLKVAAATTATNPALTYGTDPLGPPIGTLAFELGAYRATTTAVLTAPAFVLVWSTDGGTATLAVTQKLSIGGGGGTTSTFKLTVSKNGKGVVSSNPAGIACGASGGGCSLAFAGTTSVTLTAVPDAGSSWTGWGGACSGTATTCTVVMTADKSVTALFK